MKIYFTRISKVLDDDQFGSFRIDFEKSEGTSHMYYPSKPNTAFHALELMNEVFNLGIQFERREDLANVS
jgi:hypothetical protein